jgi:hypothetical protein
MNPDLKDANVQLSFRAGYSPSEHLTMRDIKKHLKRDNINGLCLFIQDSFKAYEEGHGYVD